MSGWKSARFIKIYSSATDFINRADFHPRAIPIKEILGWQFVACKLAFTRLNWIPSLYISFYFNSNRLLCIAINVFLSLLSIIFNLLKYPVLLIALWQIEQKSFITEICMDKTKGICTEDIKQKSKEINFTMFVQNAYCPKRKPILIL